VKEKIKYTIFFKLLINYKIIKYFKMSDLNGTNNSDSIMLNNEQTAPTLNDLISPNNDNKKLEDILSQTVEKIKPIENIDTAPNNNSELDSLPKVSLKVNETEPLSMKILSKDKQKQSSGIINIPQSITEKTLKDNTLNESIKTTINRDLSLIYKKLKYVINPFTSKEVKKNEIRQWDLWGPLLLDMILALTLSFDTKEKSQMTSLIFIIFWLGGVLLYLNANFLGVKTSIFQMYCLLGYCLFPLNISAIILTIFSFNDIIRLIIVMITLVWSIYSSCDYLKIIANQEQIYLVLYPCILFYLYISWFIFTAKNK